MDLLPTTADRAAAMLDPAYIREHLAAVRDNCRNRGVTADVDEVVRLDDERRLHQRQFDELRAKQNQLSDEIKKAGKDADRRNALVAESKAMKDRLAAHEAAAKAAEERRDAVLRTVPNLSHPDAPVDPSGVANKVVAAVGDLPAFDFAPKDHVDLLELLDLADLEAGTKVAGQKFYFLKNEGALLELALVQYAVQKAVAAGFTPVITPDLARADVLEGVGFLPRDPNPETRQVYAVADTDLCLIGTAEITLGGMHKDHTFDEDALPRRYVGVSHCFRTEAGAAGRDTRGIYRVHQFTKVELFAFTTPDQSEAMHAELRALEEDVFRGLGVPFRVVDICTGDLGGPAYRKFDLEAWMPGRGADRKGEFGEVTSTSNCTDYQARRLNIRYRPRGQKGTKFVHTLNGTAVACTRAIVAILENFQRVDGSVAVPEPLQPLVGTDVIRGRRPA